MDIGLFIIGIFKASKSTQTCTQTQLPIRRVINISLNAQSVLRGVRIPFESEFSSQCNLVLPLASAIILFSLRLSSSCLSLLPRLLVPY